MQAIATERLFETFTWEMIVSDVKPASVAFAVILILDSGAWRAPICELPECWRL